MEADEPDAGATSSCRHSFVMSTQVTVHPASRSQAAGDAVKRLASPHRSRSESVVAPVTILSQRLLDSPHDTAARRGQPHPLNTITVSSAIPRLSRSLHEMWERFSYYGMRAFILFMTAAPATGGLGSTPVRRGIYGLYTAMVYDGAARRVDCRTV
jgi:hypothetical protein